MRGMGEESLARANTMLLRLERAWLHGPGIPGRPWFKSLYAASDESSGYAAWLLPGLRHAVEHRDAAALRRMRELYVTVLRRLEAAVSALEQVVAT